MSREAYLHLYIFFLFCINLDVIRSYKWGDFISKISCPICGRVHDKSYLCEAKKKRQQERSKENSKRVDTKIYNSNKWKRLRDNILEEYNNIDLFSYYVEGRVVVADCVHHIVEICDNQDMAYDWDNLMPLSLHKHRRIVHKIYNYRIELKKELQQMLVDMLEDWNKGNRELGSFKERFNNIVRDVDSGFIIL